MMRTYPTAASKKTTLPGATPALPSNALPNKPKKTPPNYRNRGGYWRAGYPPIFELTFKVL